MTVTVNVQDAKTRLSQLLRQVESGQEVVIARDGAPVARLIALASPPLREVGFVAAIVPDSFADPLPEAELAAWE